MKEKKPLLDYYFDFNVKKRGLKTVEAKLASSSPFFPMWKASKIPSPDGSTYVGYPISQVWSPISFLASRGLWRIRRQVAPGRRSQKEHRREGCRGCY
jgi:hypothetical protein